MPDRRDVVLRLATRGSKLAVAQSSWVARQVEAAHENVRVELVTVTTSGDRIQDRPLYEAGGKGLFTKEVEQALLAGEADFAVHSFKDVPVTMPLVPAAEHALTIVAVPEREDVRDVLLTPDDQGLDGLKPEAIVGTSSPRRKALLLNDRPDLRIVSLRGNIDTRLQRMHDGELDAIVLAAAGLKRLNLLAGRYLPLDPTIFTPAAGQGALAVQCRTDDAATRERLGVLDHEPTRRCVAVERGVVEGLEGNCTSPIGAWAETCGEGVLLRVAWHDGNQLRRTSSTGPADTVLGDVLNRLWGPAND